MTSADDFMSFIEWLNGGGIPYFIAWGYEKLPEQCSGGDVDMYVHPECYVAVAEQLRKRGYSSAKCPANHMHEHFGQAGNHSIDLFSSFCFPFMGKIAVLNIDFFKEFGSKRWKKFSIASPMAEMLFTTLRVLGGRKDDNCMERIKKYIGMEEKT